MLQLLERRLDNVVFRAGFAASRPEARQMVRHGHFTVNGRRVNIPSFEVREGDLIVLAEASRSMPRFKEMAAAMAARTVPAWIEVNVENLSARVARLPQREEIDIPVQEHLIIELYSR
jgi:small subunit ribosomal protein S4